MRKIRDMDHVFPMCSLQTAGIRNTEDLGRKNSDAVMYNCLFAIDRIIVNVI